MKIVTHSLGFRLEVAISIGDFPNLGSHRAYEDEDGRAATDVPHRINIRAGLDDATLNVVAAHEVYHLFYLLRPLIAVDEETEAEVFGELVGRVHAAHRANPVNPVNPV